MKKNSKNQLSFNKVLGICAIVFVALLPPILVMQDMHKIASAYFLSHSSVRVEATVMSMNINTHNKCPGTPARGGSSLPTGIMTDYTFTVLGVEYRGSDCMPQKYYIPSSRVKVKYYPKNPSYNQLLNTQYSIGFSTVLLSSLVLPIGVIAGLAYLLTGRKNKNLKILTYVAGTIIFISFFAYTLYTFTDL